MKWYVINALAGQESKIKSKIEMEIKHNGLEKYVNQVVVPKEAIIRNQKGKKIKTERNYFPGYILIECDINGEIIKNIINLEGVIGFLGDSKKTRNQPIPLRQNEVNKFLGTMDELIDKVTEIDSKFYIGEAVVVTDGPFVSFHGKISKVDTERKRIFVDVAIFGRLTPLELNYTQVNKE